MPADQADHSIHLEIDPDGLSARFVIKPPFPRHLLNEPMCLRMLRDAGVEITADVCKAVADLLANPPGADQVQHVVVARAAPPVHGRDGRLEWLVGPSAASPPAAQTNALNISHYERTSIIIVRADQVIGILHDPTPSQDGRDVFGRTILGKPGRELSVDLHESILKKPTGELVAQISGLLDLSSKTPRVRSTLEIPGHVDFSTGNIDFPGKVLIHGSVRDRFTVRTEGDLEVRGLIEAATIHCLGNLHAPSGMSGREHGQINVTGNVHAKYLDNFRGSVGGDLKVDREILNCNLTVDGSILSPTCRVVGGRLTAAGIMEIGQLGSPRGVSTVLILGSMPKLENYAEKLDKIIATLTTRQSALVTEQSHSNQFIAKTRSSDRERQTEIFFELHSIRLNLAKATAVRSALSERIRARQTVTVTIRGSIYRDVVLMVNGRPHTVRNELRGPVKLWCDSSGSVVFEHNSSGARPLSAVADPGPS